MGSWLFLYYDMGLVGSLFVVFFNSVIVVFIMLYWFLYDLLGFFRLFISFGVIYMFMFNFVLEWLINVYYRCGVDIEGIDLYKMCCLIIVFEFVYVEGMWRFVVIFVGVGFVFMVLGLGYGLVEVIVVVLMLVFNMGFCIEIYVVVEVVIGG